MPALPSGLPWLLLMFRTSLAADAPWPSLEEPPRGLARDGACDAAVIVAIEDYLLLPDVPGAVDNGIAWYRFLRQRGVPTESIELLLDETSSDLEVAATDEAIRRVAERAASAVGADCTLWFVFIGHGAPATTGRDGVLVGADASASAGGIASRGVPREDILAILSTGAQRHTAVIVDACFSGRGASGAPLVEGLQAVVPRGLIAGEATELLAAGGAEFAGPLPGARRPAFSYLVLGALRGWGDFDGDGAVTPAEAHRYAAQALGMFGREQTPVLAGPAQWPASRAKERGPSLDAIRLEGEKPATEFVTTLDVSQALDRQRCEQHADEQGRADRLERLATMATEVQRTAAEVWARLEEESKRCMVLADRSACIAAVEQWLGTARQAEVRLPARTVHVRTDCGPVRRAFDAIDHQVEIPQIERAKAVLRGLRLTPGPKEPRVGALELRAPFSLGPRGLRDAHGLRPWKTCGALRREARFRLSLSEPGQELLRERRNAMRVGRVLLAAGAVLAVGGIAAAYLGAAPEADEPTPLQSVGEASAFASIFVLAAGVSSFAVGEPEPAELLEALNHPDAALAAD